MNPFFKDDPELSKGKPKDKSKAEKLMADLTLLVKALCEGLAFVKP